MIKHKNDSLILWPSKKIIIYDGNGNIEKEMIYLFSYSQEKYVEKYQNGNLKVDAFIVGKTLDSIYKEYYENGNIKTY